MQYIHAVSKIDNDKICKPRILILAGPHPVPATLGGSVFQLIDMMLRENEKHHKADFFVISASEEKAQLMAEQFLHTKFFYLNPKNLFINRAVSKVARIIAKHTGLDLPDPYIVPVYYKRALKIVESIRTDCIVIEGGEQFNLKYIKRLCEHRKFYYHLHSNKIPTPAEDILFSRVIGVSSFVINDWSKNSRNHNLRTHIVYNAVDEDRFGRRISVEERLQVRKSLGFTADDFVIAYCGRIVPEKGAEELITAVNSIDDNHVKLLIMGSVYALAKTGFRQRTYLNKIQRLVKQSSSRIRYIGYIHNDELYRYYQSSDVQCVPSIWEEPGALSVLEGMYSGLPLIITRSGGIVEYVDEHCAIQVERGDNMVNDLANAIIKLRDNPKLRKSMGEASLKRSKKFTKRKYYDDFCAVFDKHK